MKFASVNFDKLRGMNYRERRLPSSDATKFIWNSTLERQYHVNHVYRRMQHPNKYLHRRVYTLDCGYNFMNEYELYPLEIFVFSNVGFSRSLNSEIGILSFGFRNSNRSSLQVCSLGQYNSRTNYFFCGSSTNFSRKGVAHC